MRGIAGHIRTKGWQRVVTLACLLAFVFVAAAHAGHHLASVEITTVATAAPHSDTSDDGDAAAHDGICIFCALSFAEVAVAQVTDAPALRVRVESADFKLTTRAVPAEFPPPIT